MSDVKETIYLFTTTRISLYKRDLLNAFCNPDGWCVEFGYKKDYVPLPLLSNTKEKIDGHPVVIIFCEPINDGDLYYKYYPIRKGVIGTTIKDLSECLTVPITLSDVFNYSASDIESRIDDFQKFVAGSMDRPRTLNSEKLGSKQNIFVRSATDCFKADYWAPWGTYWYPLTDTLSKRKGLNDAYFMRLEPKRDSTSAISGIDFPDAKLGDGGRPKWKIVGGKSYRIRLEVRTGSKEHAPLKITTDSDLVNSIGPFERQSGDGTHVEYLIAPKRTFQVDYCMFEARVEPGKDNLSRSSKLTGVLETSPSWGLLPLTLFLLIGGALVLSLDLALLTKYFGESNSEKWLSGTAAIWVTKSVGTIAMALGGWLGFRKLPLKS